MRVLLHVCARLQRKNPAVVQDSFPLRDLLHVSGVLLCHVSDALTQLQHEYFACVKADDLQFGLFLCMHVCVHADSAELQCAVHVLAVHPSRLPLLLPIVLAPHTLETCQPLTPL